MSQRYEVLVEGYVRGNSKVGSTFDLEDDVAKPLVTAGKIKLLSASTPDPAQQDELVAVKGELAAAQKQVELLKVENAQLLTQAGDLEALKSDASAMQEALTVSTQLFSELNKAGATPLSESTPERSTLINAGIYTRQQLKEASDEVLTGLPKIGDATVAKIRAANA